MRAEVSGRSSREEERPVYVSACIHKNNGYSVWTKLDGSVRLPRLSQTTQRKRRGEIAAAALRCFARKGFAKTSIADVIAECGLSSGSIYSHFSGKSELIAFAFAEWLVAEFQEPLEELQVAGELTPADVTAWMLERHNDPSQAQMMMQLWSEAPRTPALSVLVAENLAKIKNLVSTALLPWASARTSGVGVEAVAADAADAIITISQGFVMRIAIEATIDAATLRRAICTTLGATGEGVGRGSALDGSRERTCQTGRNDQQPLRDLAVEDQV